MLRVLLKIESTCLCVVSTRRTLGSHFFCVFVHFSACSCFLLLLELTAACCFLGKRKKNNLECRSSHPCSPCGSAYRNTRAPSFWVGLDPPVTTVNFLYSVFFRSPVGSTLLASWSQTQGLCTYSFATRFARRISPLGQGLRASTLSEFSALP